MKKVVVGFGALNYDHIYKVNSLAHGDDQVYITHSHSSPGGSAANAIAGLAMLDIDSGFIGAVGPDHEGNEILVHMQELGIETSKIKAMKVQKTSKVLIFVDPCGERAMYTLPGASSEFEPQETDIKYLNQSQYTIISSLPGNKQLENLKQIISKIQRNTKIVFMPGGFYSRFGFIKLKNILLRSDIIVLNCRELKLITGKKYSSGVKWLINNGCKLVLVTLGDSGCLIRDENGQTEIPTVKLPKSKVIDSTGAGDAFTAGLIYGLLTDRSIFGAAFIGNLAGRCCVQCVGARTNLPTKKVLEKQFKKYSKVITNG